MSGSKIIRISRRFFILLLIISAILTVFFSVFTYDVNQTAPKPVKGVLDLSGWDIDNGRPSLAGEWEFYWDRLLTYGDFDSRSDQNTQYVYVPKTWNSYEENGEKLPGYGYATYRLKLIVRDPNQTLSMRVDTMSTSYRMFINDKEIASNGEAGTDSNTSRPGYRPTVVDFQPPAKEFYIIIQVSNFTYARGGIWYEINLGTHKQIEALNRVLIYKDAVLVGSLLIMALYYASFYLALQRDKSYLYFMLLCIIFIIRTSLYGDMFICRLIPGMPFGLLIFLTYATLYWITIVIFLMIDSLYENSLRKKFRKLFLIYGIAATTTTAMLPIHVYTRFITEIEMVGIAMVVFSVCIVARAFLKKENGASLILLAMFVILATGVHDVLYQANVIHHFIGELASIGIFLFMFIFSFILASRFSDAFEKSKKLSEKLAESLKKEKEAADELVRTEMSFLKAQIKPHFIYNSLSVIAALTEDDPRRAKGLLYDLTDYLRGSFHFDNYNGMAPLADELETVKAYISIEKARFGNRLQVEYNIDEAVSAFIPLLTIQPIVENAVRHGIFKKPGGGKVSLSILEDGDFFIIRVKDEGVGIPQAKLDEILLEQDSVKGVGLKNINRRLNLFYGRGLEIESREGLGTSVTIKIPKEGGLLV